MGCRRKAAAAELFRVVVSPDGRLMPGAGEPGRGAWLCQSSLDCLDLAVRRKAFGRALRTALSGEATAGLRALFEGRELSMCEDVGPQQGRGTRQVRGTTQPGGTAAKD